MARTAIEVPMRTQNAQAAFDVIHRIATYNGYQQKIYKNETVWSKGDGALMKVMAFTAQYTGRSMVIFGWMDDAITGESDLNGFVACIPKGKMKKLMNEMAAAITSQGL